MKDKQRLLFPPLDEEPSKDGTAKEDASLPQELQDRFAKVRSLMRLEAVANDGSNDDHEQDAELKRKQQEAALDTAKAVHDEMTRLQNGIAELEAMYATQQRQQLLSDDDGDEDFYSDDEDDGEIGMRGNQGDAAVIFPAFPSVANAVEPEVNADTRLSQNSNAGYNNNCLESQETETAITTEKIVCN